MSALRLDFPPCPPRALDLARRLRVMAACTSEGRQVTLAVPPDDARALARMLDNAIEIATAQVDGRIVLRSEHEARVAALQAQLADAEAVLERLHDLQARLDRAWLRLVLWVATGGVLGAALVGWWLA